MNKFIKLLFNELFLSCRNIVSLDLWRAKSLTPNGIIRIFQNCSNLEEIDLGWW